MMRTAPAPRTSSKARRRCQLDPRQRQQIKDAIARQTDAPKIAKAPFEMMIGTAVPRQVPLKDIRPEVTQVMNGFNGDQYVLVQDEMVIVDHDSRRVVAISRSRRVRWSFLPHRNLITC